MPVETPLLPTDELVTSIFDGILEERPWQSFLYHIRMRTDSEVSALSLRPGGQGVNPIVLVDRRYEISKERARRMAKKYGEMVDIDPISANLRSRGAVLNLSDILDDEALEANEFYRVLMKPLNVKHYIGACFGEPNGWNCLLRLMNRPDKPGYDAKDEALLRELLPYLEKALSLFSELRRARSELREFRESLGRLTIGALVLDSAGRVIDSNEVGMRIFNENPAISIVSKKIVINNPRSQARFDLLTKQALEWAERNYDSPFVESLRVEISDGSALDILIRTLRNVDRFIGATSPAIAIYISHSLTPFRIHVSFLENLFGLTATEARLASLLADGNTLSEAAKTLGVTDTTVRGYSKAIFSKVGVNRQADLVRVILKSVAMIA